MTRLRFLIVLLILMVAAPIGHAWGKEPPPTLNGLRVTAEKLAKPSEAKSGARQYLTEITLYSLRQPGDQLEATIQVGRLRRGSPSDSLTFKRAIAGQVGSTVPQEQRVAGVPVFVTRVKKLSVALWFREGHLFILSIREGYAQPKTLIREALRMSP